MINWAIQLWLDRQPSYCFLLSWIHVYKITLSLIWGLYKQHHFLGHPLHFLSPEKTPEVLDTQGFSSFPRLWETVVMGSLFPCQCQSGLLGADSVLREYASFVGNSLSGVTSKDLWVQLFFWCQHSRLICYVPFSRDKLLFFNHSTFKTLTLKT